ncbi:23S rRNA (guanine(745)-N(1))-methyltransferase [Cognaticolwellia beringensis]|uniref:23S rRNA (Guanine(745)-N(1))-methyltransferase n=1 Tax=Cognaticolwellia beringensis TaxID=1967665 RepID=A0A222GEC0_9GAMM|nr:23S rRNA (guanine(745)-N(1))-methyltransferase [Cognaticolwellia beringensis]ASP49714.1 23S rRNA (guanine(745)-N(1))-methyltransferase [Cognaticolwellia beringensis]
MTIADYACPLCSLPLLNQAKIFRCENNHSFDLAKENYLNLLPVQFKHSKNPGDNKAMVNARRAFLEKGYYQPLVDRLVALYQEKIITDADKPTIVLDAGCGEGFYTHQHKTAENTVYGVDIAKEAIKKAGKKYPQCHFSVATLSKLPFAESLFSWIVSVYAPILEQEFTRVLSNGGFLLTVTPAKQHLMQLKQHIYDDAKEHDVEKLPIAHLALVHQENISYQMHLKTGQDTLNLLAMTPFAFKASEEVKQKLSNQTDFICQADFLIRLYQKQG